MKIRTPQQTQDKLNEIKNITNYKVFLKEIMDLFLNYYETEGETAVKFDQSNGKPIEFQWLPNRKFNWFIYSHAGFNNKIKISDEIKEFCNEVIKEGPYLFKYNGKKYIIDQFKTSYYEDYVIGGVKITPINKELRL